MAKRFYFIASTSGIVTPGSYQGAWDQTASSTTTNLSLTKSGSASEATINETNVSGSWDVLLRRFVSPAFLSDGTFSGTVTYALPVIESQTSADAAAHVHVWVMQPDGTARGTLLANYVSSTGNEFGVNTPITRGETGLTLSSVAVLAGDRIVVEVGAIFRNVTTSSRGAKMYVGGTGSDLVIGTTSPSIPSGAGWIEFSGADGLYIPPLVPAETVKMYLTNETATYVPSITVGGWEAGSTSANALLTYPSGAVAATGVTNSTTTANYDVRARMFISEPALVAGRIGGFVEWMARVRASSADLHAVTYLAMWVTVGDTDVIRGASKSGSGIVEWQYAAGVYEAMYLSTTYASTDIVDLQVGDRVVFEVGYRSNATVAGEIGYLVRGGTGTTDAATGDTVNGNPTWIKFQADTLGMFPAPPSTINPADFFAFF